MYFYLKFYTPNYYIKRYMKETQQSKGRQTPNLALILSKQIPVMKSILYQISVWVDELLKVHKANVDLKFKFKVIEKVFKLAMKFQF